MSVFELISESEVLLLSKEDALPIVRVSGIGQECMEFQLVDVFPEQYLHQ